MGFKKLMERAKDREELEAENARLRAALERCRAWFKTWNSDDDDDVELESPELLERMCEESLKK